MAGTSQLGKDIIEIAGGEFQGVASGRAGKEAVTDSSCYINKLLI
jgi:hypothetical protein